MMALFGNITREQQLTQELEQAKRTITALSNAGQFDSWLSPSSNDRAEGYAAGLEAAAKLLEQGWVEDGTYWVANGLTNSAAKAIRALGKEGP